MNGSITVQLKGYKATLTKDTVLKKARQALANGVPREAQRYKTWAVKIDDTWVGADWLFGLVTGFPRKAFITDDSRRHLGKLGLIAEERSRPASASVLVGQTHVSRSTEYKNGGWEQICAKKIEAIRAFLGGLSSSRPKDEELCDWVQFCYTLELNVEARDLFVLVSPEEVNPWYFERIKKLAQICTLKANVHV